ncbi:MAG: TIGR02678 family protein [Gemmatimonadetes bacterium]|nr:TIGR02678 family protein [Acidimicrobiaceae bacterium]MYB28617.1 TIGR02678 family protein [Acidimicrobiaceae bacterium]MYI64486.1 TIGR02678 family protein [Gemmatimonadota bacterium]
MTTGPGSGRAGLEASTHSSARPASEPPPEIALDLRAAARHLVVHPMVAAEQEPEMFRLIRRHEAQLDRWFTQRFGYRLQVSADTARLFKSSTIAGRRPLHTEAASARPFAQREYTMLALTLAAMAAGPEVISLRDLIQEIRSAAADAAVTLSETPSDRRALVTALRWLIGWGMVAEVHARIDSYASDGTADAVLRVRPDRVALLALPVLARSETTEQLLERSEQRRASRPWMRSMLLEEPVVYRSDLTDDEWSELRRRLGEERDIFDEMFGLSIEARAEGLAAIDPEGGLTDSRFPAGGTVRQAALLLIDCLVAADRNPVERSAVVAAITDLAEVHRVRSRHWGQIAENPELLADDVLELLQDHRLVQVSGEWIELLPAAWRYAVDVRIEQGSFL